MAHQTKRPFGPTPNRGSGRHGLCSKLATRTIVELIERMKRYTSYKPTQIPWPNELPTHWELVKISSVFKERTETVSDKDFAPLSVTMQGIVPQLETAAKTENGENRKKVCKGDFVINSRSDRKGSAGISPLDGSVSVISTVLKPQSQLNEKYIGYLLTNYYFQEEFYRYGKGIVADLWSTKYSNMKNMFITLPPVKEQTAIANYLDTKTEQLNTFITKKQKLIHLLKEQKQAIINELLQDKQNKWEKRKLKFLCRIKNGYAFDANTLSENGVQIIKIGNLYKNELSLDRDPTFVNSSLFDALPDFQIKENDILISMTGTLGKKDYGYAVIVNSNKKLLLNQRVAKLMPKNRIIRNDFFLNMIWSNDFLDQLYSKPAGTKQANLSSDMIMNSSILVPSLLEQERVVQSIKLKTSKIENAISRIEKEIEMVKELKQSLIAEVVTGKIKVI